MTTNHTAESQLTFNTHRQKTVKTAFLIVSIKSPERHLLKKTYIRTKTPITHLKKLLKVITSKQQGLY